MVVVSENKQEVPLKVAIYLRVSTEDQVEKYGLKAQRAAIEGAIKSKGTLEDGVIPSMVLAGKAYEYVDGDIGGRTELDQRPEFRRLKEDILNSPQGGKPFDVVAVFKIDRFARKLRILMDVIKFFEEYKIEFVSATESIDTSTPFGRAMLGIMGVIAELELENILERTQKGREQAIKEGVFMGTHAPYGYQKDKDRHLIVLEKEAAVVERIFYLFTVEKQTPQRIADILTADEILSPDASAVKYKKRKGVSRKTNDPYFWRAERVRDILSDDVYTGVLYYNKSKKRKRLPKSEWKQVERRHKEIILAHIFELAKQQLKTISDRKILTKRQEDNHIYPLSGLLKCDFCRSLNTSEKQEMMSWTGGKKEVGKQSGHYSYYYFCNRKNRKKFTTICPVVPIPAEPLEKYVITFIKELLSDPRAAYEHQRNLESSKLSTQHLESKKEHFIELLNSLPDTRKNILFQHEIGEIDKPTLENKLVGLNGKDVELKEKIDELDFKLSQISLSKGYEASLELYAEKYRKVLEQDFKDERELHELIHSLVHQIVVYSRPANLKDKIAGRKKEGQMIPNKIDIYLHLPQNLLRELYTHKFGVRSDNLWAERDFVRTLPDIITQLSQLHTFKYNVNYAS